MKFIKSLFCFLLLMIFVFVAGCAPQTPQTHFESKGGLYFKFPEGWDELSKKEWKQRKMGKDNTLITVMDKKRLAGFSIIPVPLDMDMQISSQMLGSEMETRIAFFLESIDAAGPQKYTDYKLISKDGALFAGIPMGEIIYQGQLTGRALRWYRILVAAAPEKYDTLLMLVYTTPVGEQDYYKQDFQTIENSWKWKK